MNTAVNKLCKDFARLRTISLGDDPLLAYNRCWDLSLAFSFFCQGRGFKAEMLRLESPIKPLKIAAGVKANFRRDQLDNPDMLRLLTHNVVWFPKEKVFVDWTARQFWKNLPHPWIGPRTLLAQYWDCIGE